MAYTFITSEIRSSIMKKIKYKDTICEIQLRSALWKSGIRIKKNVNALPGKPDIVMPKYSTVVFVDGDFWHGRNWSKKREKIKSNREYWLHKIQGNINRDRRITKQLKSTGWNVIRIWESDIKQDIQKCVKHIQKVIKG